jgi:Uma2 family endonuclease
MATAIAPKVEGDAAAPAVTPDRVISFPIRPGTLPLFRDAMADGGPLIKCYQGELTLVSPGFSHETFCARLATLVVVLCAVLRIPIKQLRSTYFELPQGTEDSGYEPDEGYYVQSFGNAPEGHRPDLVVEIVVSHSERKALAVGLLLRIPEVWVLNVPRRTLVFHHLVTRGKNKGTYQRRPRSRAFPFLEAAEVMERLQDPVEDDAAFHENCREWAARVLLPRYRGPANGR